MRHDGVAVGAHAGLCADRQKNGLSGLDVAQTAQAVDCLNGVGKGAVINAECVADGDNRLASEHRVRNEIVRNGVTGRCNNGRRTGACDGAGAGTRATAGGRNLVRRSVADGNNYLLADRNKPEVGVACEAVELHNSVLASIVIDSHTLTHFENCVALRHCVCRGKCLVCVGTHAQTGEHGDNHEHGQKHTNELFVHNCSP